MNCLSCASEIASHKKYCTNQCQQDFQRSQLLKEWLETGELKENTKRDSFARLYLMDQQGDSCGLCSNPSEWMGKPLTFTLDHINGDAKDNRRENLRLICPNCDSQLDTYKGRNKGRGTREPRVNRYY